MTIGLLFGLVAVAYAMVGHGGASGYLAIGSLLGLDPQELRSQALVLNLIVAGFAAYAFTRQGYLRPRLLFILAAFSVPAAFLGARLPLDPAWARAFLGVCLFAAAFRMFFHFWLVQRFREAEPSRPRWEILALAGASLGFLAGLTGVGGGIYLSPLLLLMGWATVKQTAAVSAWFIWLNSTAGLAGIVTVSGIPSVPLEWVLPAAAGGFVGARFGAAKVGEVRLRQVLGTVLAVAAVKLILTSNIL